MEKHSMMALSTTHVSQKTAIRMEANDIDAVTIYQKNDVGWFVPIPEESYFEELKDSSCPEDLYQCMKYALNNGCTWLMFDSGVDENEAPELPTYNW